MSDHVYGSDADGLLVFGFYVSMLFTGRYIDRIYTNINKSRADIGKVQPFSRRTWGRNTRF